MSAQPDPAPGPANLSGSAYDYLLGALTAASVPLIAVRILHAADVISITNPVIDTAMLLGALLVMALAFTLAVRRIVVRYRVRLVERDEVIAQRDQTIADVRAQRDAAAARAATLEGLLADGIRQVDIAVDVQGVRIQKIIRMMEEQRIADEDTQPIAHLHSISGGRNS